MAPDSKEFKALQAKWAKKLKNSGFEDIEQPDGNLKKWASHFFLAKHRLVGSVAFAAKEEYYRLAGKFLYDHKFVNPADQTIWDLHSQGFSIPQIKQALRAAGVKMKNINVPRQLSALIKLMFETNGIKYE